MTPSSDPFDVVSQQDVVGKLHLSIECRTGGPTLEELGTVCDVLYSASLLKEEGKVVRARVVIAPPEGFSLIGGPPEGIHAVRFSAFSRKSAKPPPSTSRSKTSRPSSASANCARAASTSSTPSK